SAVGPVALDAAVAGNLPVDRRPVTPQATRHLCDAQMHLPQAAQATTVLKREVAIDLSHGDPGYNPESYPHFTWLRRWCGRVRSPRRGSSERTSLSTGSASRARRRTCGRETHPAGRPHAERIGGSGSIRGGFGVWAGGT